MRLIAACVSVSLSFAQFNLISVPDEIMLGREAQRQVKAQTPEVAGAAGAYVTGIGRQIVRRAGWDPRGMLEFMQILREQEGRDPGSVEVFLSTHPSPAERVAQLRAELTAAPSGGRRDSAMFHRVRATLEKMPRAAAMK